MTGFQQSADLVKRRSELRIELKNAIASLPSDDPQLPIMRGLLKANLSVTYFVERAESVLRLPERIRCQQSEEEEKIKFLLAMKRQGLVLETDKSHVNVMIREAFNAFENWLDRRAGKPSKKKNYMFQRVVLLSPDEMLAVLETAGLLKNSGQEEADEKACIATLLELKRRGLDADKYQVCAKIRENRVAGKAS
jgi:hypothetical protein